MLHKRQKKSFTNIEHRKAGAKPVGRRAAGHIEQSPGFIYTADITANDFQPRNCIGGFKTLTGYPASSFLKKNFYNESVVAPSDVGALQKFRFAAKSSSIPKNISYRIKTRLNRIMSVNEQVTLIHNGTATKLIGGVVTCSWESSQSFSLSSIEKDRLRFQEMERLNKHLLEVNQLKDEFLANTSHELRTPLNSIIGFLTLIAEGYYEGNDELHLFARNALDSSYHLLNVINDLLDISRIESGRMQMQIEKVYVDELLEEVRALFDVQAGQKGLSLEVTMKDGPLFASADVRRLKQVLINLAGNAVKFTSKGEVRIQAGHAGRQLVFTIKDTGIGIPENQRSKLFQKFIQVDGSATRRYGGSGLGLVISKHLVEMMGGEIKIESMGAGMGTTVSFTIPEWTEVDA